MCDASKKEKSMVKENESFSKKMNNQATEVFGKDDAIFNKMDRAYSSIVNNGPGGHGFSQNEINAKNSSVITNNANQFRNVSGAVKNAGAAIGGGNTVMPAGFTTGQELSIAESAAASTAAGLNQVTQEDYATGRDNFFRAAEGESKLGDVFNNASSLDKVAIDDQQQVLGQQQGLDAKSGWWQKPVMGLATTALSVGSGGIGSMLKGGTFASGAGQALSPNSSNG